MKFSVFLLCITKFIIFNQLVSIHSRKLLNCYLSLKPSISTHSKPRTRVLKCFVLHPSVIKTKHLRSLVQGFESVEILEFSRPNFGAFLLPININSYIYGISDGVLSTSPFTILHTFSHKELGFKE